MPETNTAETTAPEAPSKRVRRIFLHGTMRLADPDPAMTALQVKAHYAASYPDLANASVNLATDKIKETETTREETWEFRRAVGVKG